MIQRVAAYCRVSTDGEDQAGSLASQEAYFRGYIARNPEWIPAEVYVDTGKTGTSTKKRAAFNKMIADASLHKMDLIITKEISRFARNTLDSIYYTRQLKDWGVGVIFMNDNINTLEADGELRLTIMSSIAQEESRKTSERVKWGQRRRMEQGVVFGRDLLGYDVFQGELKINEEGAEIVRLIFHKFLREGKGTHIIAKELREAGIKTAAYMKEWSNTAILRCLRNEKMCGDLVQKKTYTPSYLTHEKKYNRGEEPFVVIRDHHEAIISREIFQAVQRELERRGRGADPCQRAKYSNRHCFSGKIKCALCGSTFVSRSKKRKDGSICKSWRCYKGVTQGATVHESAGEAVGCSALTVRDQELKALLQGIIASLTMDKEGIIKHLNSIVSRVCGGNPKNSMAEAQKRLEIITRKKQGLIEIYLAKEITRAEFQALKEQYESEALALEELQQNQSPEPDLTEILGRIRSIVTGELWNDTFCRNILDGIAVGEAGILCITLKDLPRKWLVFQSHFDTSEGTEELAHLEMVSTIFYQLTRNLSIKEIKDSGFASYFVDHTTGVYPADASGVPFTAAALQSTGDPIADLHEDMAAEQKARLSYDNILRMVDDPDVREPIKYLREREIVHFQRFGEGLRLVQDMLDSKNFYAFNPSFDIKK